VEQLATKVDALETAVAKLSEERDGLAGQLRDGVSDGEKSISVLILQLFQKIPK
jgi:hypothetical protein